MVETRTHTPWWDGTHWSCWCQMRLVDDKAAFNHYLLDVIERECLSVLRPDLTSSFAEVD